MAPYLVAPGGDPFEWQEGESAEGALGPAREGVLSSEQITFFKDEANHPSRLVPSPTPQPLLEESD